MLNNGGGCSGGEGGSHGGNRINATILMKLHIFTIQSEIACNKNPSALSRSFTDPVTFIIDLSLNLLHFLFVPNGFFASSQSVCIVYIVIRILFLFVFFCSGYF